MNGGMILAACLWLAVGNDPGGANERAAQERARREGALEGTWVIVSATWEGEPLSLACKEKKAKALTWNFSGERFKSFIGWKAATEAGTYRVNPTRSPKHLDLMPTEGEVLTTRKCLYALEGDDLKIAFTLWFFPGTPEQELVAAKKMRATRPKSLDAKQDLVVVLTLKRQKK
jgi:uncharacterized protein (TIGR03067 family)